MRKCGKCPSWRWLQRRAGQDELDRKHVATSPHEMPDAKARGSGVPSSACLRSKRSGTRLSETRREQGRGHPIFPPDPQGRFVPGQVRDILKDNQGFLWFNTSGVLNRYDGYHFKSYIRDAAHPNYPAGGSLNCIFKDRSGYLWISSNDELVVSIPSQKRRSAFPLTMTVRTSPGRSRTSVKTGPESYGWPLRPACTGWTRRAGTFRHYSHNSSDPASLSNSVVTSTYEDREGTLWVCTRTGLDAFDRRTEKVTDANPPERARGAVNQSARRPRWRAVDHLHVRQRTEPPGIGKREGSRHYSFKDREPPATELSGAERIYEDADGNLWLTTYGSGLVKIDPNRRSAVQYRVSRRPYSIDMDSLTCVDRGPRRDRLVGRGGHRGG